MSITFKIYLRNINKSGAGSGWERFALQLKRFFPKHKRGLSYNMLLKNTTKKGFYPLENLNLEHRVQY